MSNAYQEALYIFSQIVEHSRSMIGAGTQYGLNGAPDARPTHLGRSDGAEGTRRGKCFKGAYASRHKAQSFLRCIPFFLQ
jgi:hypothetical protein